LAGSYAENEHNWKRYFMGYELIQLLHAHFLYEILSRQYFLKQFMLCSVRFGRLRRVRSRHQVYKNRKRISISILRLLSRWLILSVFLGHSFIDPYIRMHESYGSYHGL